MFFDTVLEDLRLRLTIQNPSVNIDSEIARPAMMRARLGAEDVLGEALLVCGAGVSFSENLTPAFSSGAAVMTFSTLVRGSLVFKSLTEP